MSVVLNPVFDPVINPIRSYDQVGTVFDPQSIDGALFVGDTDLQGRSTWNQEGFQLDNEVRIAGLPTGLIPNFTNPIELNKRVVLDSTITLDCTVGWHIQLTMLANGSWSSGGTNGFGFLGDSNLKGIYTIDNFRFLFTDNVTTVTVGLPTNLNTQEIYQIDFSCDGVNITVSINGGEITDSNPIGGLTTIPVNVLGLARGREAQGLLYDIYLNSTANDTNWTNHWRGVDGDWSDQIGTNDGTAGSELTYIKNSITNLQCKTGGYFIGNSAGTHENYVDGNKVLGFGSRFEGGGWFNTTNSGNTITLLDCRDANNDGLVIVKSNLDQILLSYDTIDLVSSLTYNGGADYYYHYYLSGASVYLLIYDANGNLLETLSDAVLGSLSVTTNFRIGARSHTSAASFWDGDIKDVWHRSGFAADDYKADELRNNPQLIADYDYITADGNFDLAVTFNEGNGFSGEPVTNLADLANPLTLQSGSTDSMIGNDAEVGSQQVLLSRNIYQRFNGTDRRFDIGGIASGISALNAFTVKGKFVWQDGIDSIEGIFTNSVTTATDTFSFRITASNLVFTVSDGTTLKNVNSPIPTINQTYEYVLTCRVTGSLLEAEFWLDGVSQGTVSAASSEVDFSYLNGAWTIGWLNAARYFKGLIPNTEIYSGFSSDGTVTGLTKLHGYVGTDFVDDTGGVNGTAVGTESVRFRHETTSSQDEYGNAIQTIWKQGTLNFTGLDKTDNLNGGVECGNQVDVWDVSNGRVIAVSFSYSDTGNNQYIAINRSGLGGFISYLISTNRVVYVAYDNLGGSNFIIGTVDELVDGNDYNLVITHFGTVASYYLAEQGQAIPTTPTGSKDLGIAVTEKGTRVPRIGLSVADVESFSGLISIPQLYDKSSISSSEIKNLAEYNESLIS